MRLIADLVMTTSLSAAYSPIAWPLRSTRALSIMRSSIAIRPASHASSAEHLVEGRRGEEAEPAEVHAEERHPEVPDRARHRQERPVAAEDDDQVGQGGQLGLADRRD